MAARGSLLWTLAAAAVAASALSGCASRGDKVDFEDQASIGVNSFLWRASLDTIAFMPLASQDPWGGVINTEWYNNPEVTNERFKVTVYILDSRLRADAVNVSVNRQVLTANGWLDAESDPATSIQIENAILTRARELRLAAEAG